jgi:large subunit ribosomal protein L25
MAEITLAAEIGRPLGSPAARRLRRDGKVPGVVYGHGTNPVHVAVSARELRIALSGEAGSNTLLSLNAGDQTFLTLARDMQRHPVKNTVTHLDFLIVRRDEVIAAEVPISLVGEALEVHHGEGLVDQQLLTLPVWARPTEIPTVIEVDVSALIIGGSLKISDIVLPAGVSTDLDGEVTIVVGQPPRIQTVTEGEAEAAEVEGAPAAAEGAGSSTQGEG